MGSAESARRACINMRVSEHQERVLERAQRIEVGEESSRRFVEALDAPVEEMPTLRRYARGQSPIPAR